MTPVSILHEAEIELWEAVQFYEHRCAVIIRDGPY
jgi:hypothetical protein